MNGSRLSEAPGERGENDVPKDGVAAASPKEKSSDDQKRDRRYDERPARLAARRFAARVKIEVH
jgi:hypothetical protein